MPRKIPFHRSPILARFDSGRDYERSAPRQEDKNFYSGERWRKLRAAFLRRHPMCGAEGCQSLAIDVHHVKERKDFPELAYEWSNLAARCKPCHNRERRRH